jgi:NitT/TauT family transport system permease protein
VMLALGASFLRTSTAVLVGAAWTLPLGIVIGLTPKLSEKLQPIIQIAASFPAPMLFPLVTLAIVHLGVSFNYGCVLLMLLGAQWYILFNVIAGAMTIPAELKEVTTVYRMSRWDTWKNLYLPCVFPHLVTGLITAAGGAWNATIVSEYVQVKDHQYVAFGIGSVISEATAHGNFPLLAAGITSMACAVVLINRFLWRKLYNLAAERYTLAM